MGLLDIFRKRDDAKRMTPKTQKIQHRIYKAAETGRLFGDWKSNDNSADAEIRYQLKLIRERCRDLARNNEYARRYIKLLERNVVGERGISLQMKSRETNGALDIVANDQIERAWRQFTKLGAPTIDGRMDFVDAQNFVISSVARDGEAIVVLHESNEPGMPSIQIQFIEPDQVDETYNGTLQNGNEVRMGVELNDARRPVAYHVFENHPGDDIFNMKKSNIKRMRIPAEKVIHIYDQERAGQTRGVPWLQSVAAPLKMLNGWREASLVNQRASASKMGFFTTPAGENFPADDYDNEVPLIDFEPGTLHQLPEGVSFEAFDPHNPTTNFADFERQILKGIASSLNVSYIDLANDLESVSYSSIRQGALADRDNYRALQGFMIRHFIMPVFEAWLRATISDDKINLPIEKFDKWMDGAEFRGRGWQWVDPKKEMEAAVLGLKTGVLSMQDIANQYGRDVEETMAQIARDKQLAEQFGITFALEPFGATQMPIDPDVTGGDNADAD